MALDYVKLTDEIIAKVGGVGNITSATHCMTRLRLTLADEGKANDDAVKAIKGVKGVMKQGGQYQIIIGNEVSNLFKEFKTRGNWGDGAKASAAKPTGSPIQRLFGFVAGCMTPMLPAMLGTGMLKVVLTIATTFFGMSTEGPTYIILYSVADCFFYLLPVFLAFNIAKKMGGNPMLYAVVGAAMCYPNLITLLGEASGSFLGMPCTYFLGVIPVVSVTYTSSVLPILLMAPVMKWSEDFADRVSPNVLKAFLKPLLFLLICTPVAFCVLGPIGSIIGNYLSMGINFMYSTVPWLTVAILSAVMPLLVMTGMHYALIPLFMNNLATLGFDVVVLVTMYCSNIAQGAATFGVAAKTKDEELRSEGIACGISAVVAGVTEPALYGINLRFMKPLYAAMAGAGIGGLFCGLTAVRGYTMGGSPSLLSLITFIGGDKPMHGVIFGAIAGVIVIGTTFILSYIMFKDEEPAAEEAPAVAEAAPTGPFEVFAPIAGVAKPISECPDEVFSSGALGDGVMIVPSEGKVFAPADGEVSTLFDTLHAIGFTTADGAELLIHVGMDTVELGGKGFKAHCKTGDTVKKGDLLLEFDIDFIKSQGLPVVTPFVVGNFDEFAGLKTHLGVMNPGDKILTVLREAEEKEEAVGAETIKAPISGIVQPLSECPDKLFSSGQMGQGFVLEPEEGKVYAPCDGTIKDLFKTLHALGITSDQGAEVLLHIGMDTVDLNAMGFKAHCKTGDKVKAGDLLIEFDIPYIKSKGLPVTTPVIITNGDAYKMLMLKKMGSAAHGDDVLELQV